MNSWLNGWGMQIPGHPSASQQLGSIASRQADQQGTYIASTASRKSIQLFPCLLLADKPGPIPSPQL